MPASWRAIFHFSVLAVLLSSSTSSIAFASGESGAISVACLSESQSQVQGSDAIPWETAKRSVLVTMGKTTRLAMLAKKMRNSYARLIECPRREIRILDVEVSDLSSIASSSSASSEMEVPLTFTLLCRGAGCASGIKSPFGPEDEDDEYGVGGHFRRSGYGNRNRNRRRERMLMWNMTDATHSDFHQRQLSNEMTSQNQLSCRCFLPPASELSRLASRRSREIDISKITALTDDFCPAKKETKQIMKFESNLLIAFRPTYAEVTDQDKAAVGQLVQDVYQRLREESAPKEDSPCESIQPQIENVIPHVVSDDISTIQASAVGQVPSPPPPSSPYAPVSGGEEDEDMPEVGRSRRSRPYYEISFVYSCSSCEGVFSMVHVVGRRRRKMEEASSSSELVAPSLHLPSTQDANNDGELHHHSGRQMAVAASGAEETPDHNKPDIDSCTCALEEHTSKLPTQQKFLQRLNTEVQAFADQNKLVGVGGVLDVVQVRQHQCPMSVDREGNRHRSFEYFDRDGSSIRTVGLAIETTFMRKTDGVDDLVGDFDRRSKLALAIEMAYNFESFRFCDGLFRKIRADSVRPAKAPSDPESIFSKDLQSRQVDYFVVEFQVLGDGDDEDGSVYSLFGPQPNDQDGMGSYRRELEGELEEEEQSNNAQSSHFKAAPSSSHRHLRGPRQGMGTFMRRKKVRNHEQTEEEYDAGEDDATVEYCFCSVDAVEDSMQREDYRAALDAMVARWGVDTLTGVARVMEFDDPVPL